MDESDKSDTIEHVSSARYRRISRNMQSYRRISKGTLVERRAITEQTYSTIREIGELSTQGASDSDISHVITRRPDI